jgi:hypothetical protein
LQVGRYFAGIGIKADTQQRLLGLDGFKESIWSHIAK